MASPTSTAPSPSPSDSLSYSPSDSYSYSEGKAHKEKEREKEKEEEKRKRNIKSRRDKTSPYLRKLREEIQLERAKKYFEKNKSSWDLMAEIVARKREKKTISLRALEFFCVKMSKENSLFVEKGERSIPIHKEYENCLHTHKKRAFDSFRRKGKDHDSLIEMSLHGETLKTNIAQLNFFMLMDSVGILKVAVDRASEISEEMSGKGKKRREKRRKL